MVIQICKLWTVIINVFPYKFEIQIPSKLLVELVRLLLFFIFRETAEMVQSGRRAQASE